MSQSTIGGNSKALQQGLIVLGLILFGGYLLFDRGLMGVLLEGDKSRLSWLILGRFCSILALGRPWPALLGPVLAHLGPVLVHLGSWKAATRGGSGFSCHFGSWVPRTGPKTVCF